MDNDGQHTIATNAPFSLALRTTADRPAARSRSQSSRPAHLQSCSLLNQDCIDSCLTGEQVIVPSSTRRLVSSSHLVPVVVSSAAFPYRAPFSLARRYSFLFFSSRSRRIIPVVPSSVSSRRLVVRPVVHRRLIRRLIRRTLSPRAPFRLARRSSSRSVLVPPPSRLSSRRSVVVPSVVPPFVSSSHPSARPHSPSPDTAGRGVFFIRWRAG